MTQRELYAHRDALFERAARLMVSKNTDYGTLRDPLANFRSAQLIGMDPRMGILLRMLDKISRLGSLVERGRLETRGETAIDSLIDLCNYAALFYAMLLEEKGALVDGPRRPDHGPGEIGGN